MAETAVNEWRGSSVQGLVGMAFNDWSLVEAAARDWWKSGVQ